MFGGGKDNFGIYRHFCSKHPESEVVIKSDGRIPKCDLCGMRAKDLGRHQQSSTCKKLRGRRESERKQDLQAKASKVTFQVNGKNIERVRSFRYLGRILTDNDDDEECVTDNLRRARQKWGVIAKILKREGANPVCMSRFYLTVVQAVLLYGADTWVIGKRDMGRLRSFHRRAIRHMTGQHIRKGGDDEWEYPDHGELMRKCKLFEMETYIERRRGTLRKYLEEHRETLLGEAKQTGRHSRDVHKILWWNQKWISRPEMTQMRNLWYP